MGRKTKQSSSFWYSRSRSSSAPTTPRPEPAAAAVEPPVGCMSMVHYLIFAPGAGCVGRPPTSTSSSAAIVTLQDGHGHGHHRRRHDDKHISGFEAPRNSLDDLDDADNPNDIQIQIGVQIEPVFDALAGRTTAASSSARRPSSKKPSSEAETPRTPSLVARLMGIDGLPDSPSPAATARRRTTTTSATKENDDGSSCCGSPPPASKGEKKKRVIPESMNRREPLRSLSCNVAVVGDAARRSLPETPARASWDGPRLSLQALKENVLDRAAHYMSMPSSPTSLASAAAGERRKTKKKDAACSRRRDEEKAAAAKEHAREILRHAKETVASRKEKSAAGNYNNNSSSASSSPAPEKKRQSMSSCFNNNKENVVEDAAKLRAVVVPAKPTATAAPAKPRAEHRHHSGPRVALAPRQQLSSSPPPPPPQRAKPSRPPPPPPPLDPPRTRARKPDGCERFATRIKKPAACAPATTTSAAASTTATDCRSASAAVLYGGARVSSSPPLDEDPEYRYLRAVLERGGFMRPSPPAPPPRRQAAGRGHCHSVASAPVDPIVFHLLELELPADDEARQLGPLRHRWNRKLLFHLAQELLADLLLSSSPTKSTSTGLPLLGKVWRRARSFPAADCKVVGDIDALVAADLGTTSVLRRRHPAVAVAAEEEAGDVAEEVADRVLDALVAECVAESVSLSCAALGLSSSRAAAR